MPVLPLVASTTVLPRESLPDARPARIMLRAGRSFTEPPGLNHSAFARNWMFGNSLPTRSRRRSGVFPIRSSTDCPTAKRVTGNWSFVDARSVVAISRCFLRRGPHSYATEILRIGCNSPCVGYSRIVYPNRGDFGQIPWSLHLRAADFTERPAFFSLCEPCGMSKSGFRKKQLRVLQHWDSQLAVRAVSCAWKSTAV